MPRKVPAPVMEGRNPHHWFSHDSDAEGQFSESMPWFERVRPLLTGIPPTTTLLDVGCNSGGLGNRLTSGVGCYVLGVDLAFHLLPEARKKGYVAVLQADAAALPFRRGSFPVVVMSEVLEHVPDPVACVEEAARVLMPRGWLLGDVPHPFGKWGWRSIRGHKWHKHVYTKHRLFTLLERRFVVNDYSLRFGSWRAGMFLPQWQAFKAIKV